MTTCMGFGGTQQQGGRRRRRNGKTKKMRGGNFYSFKGAIGTNGAEWGAQENLAADSATGRILPNNGSELLAAPLLGGRRRRGKGKKVTRKGGRKSRRVPRRRTMRGGAPWLTAGAVGYGYGGDSLQTRGPTDVVPYNPRALVAGGPVQGGDGAFLTS